MSFRQGRLAASPLAADISDRFFLFLTCSALMLVASILVPVPGAEKMLLGAGLGMLFLALLGCGFLAWRGFDRYLRETRADRLMRGESRPAILTDGSGRLLRSNPSAGRLGIVDAGTDVQGLVNEAFGAGYDLCGKLLALAHSEGLGREVRSLDGSRLCVEVRQVAYDRFVWTFDQRMDQPEPTNDADRVARLSLAPDNSVVATNAMAKRFLTGTPSDLVARVGDQPLETGLDIALDGVDGPAAVTVIELRNDEGWRDLALVPSGKVGGGPTGEILSEPGLLEALPVPMLKIAADGHLIEANREARAILSLTSGPLPHLYELVEGMGRPINDWLADAAQGRGLLKPEIVRAVNAGQELFLQITLGRAVENGRPVLVGILNDATELKTLEAQFVQSQKMQAIGQLAGGVAHDFNNLLTAISGHCDLLLLRHDSGDPDYADLMQISQNSNRAASLVGQLLAFSRKQNLKPQALDLRDTMSDLAHLLNRLIGERIQLDVIHARGSQIIRADRRQLEQVIVNLVVNARDAMPGGGRITVSIRCDTLARELVRDRARVPSGDYVVIEVRDTGTGIPAEGIAKIFEPFYTTKKTGEGTGLGLSTAYGIVKQTGGFIFVDSGVDEGTAFSLYFPASEAVEEAHAKPATAPDTAKSAHGGGVVLLVEDEAPVRAFASRALQMRGYTVIEAADAEEALRTLDDTSLHVDVFVTDVIMPGLDGPTWVRQALKTRPDTPTVFVSGYSEEGRVEEQSRIPNSVFLPKPFSLHQLTAVVNEQFG